MATINKSVSIRIFFLLAVLMLLALSLYTYYRVDYLIDNSKKVNKNFVLQNNIEKIYSYVKEVETHNRGFMISHDSVFYNSIMEAEKNVTTSMKALRNQFPEEEFDQYKKLEELVNKKIFHLSIIRNEDLNPKNILDSKLYMDSLRNQIELMQTHIQQGMDVKIENLNRSTYIAPIFTLALILFSLLLIFFSYFHVTNELKKSKQLKNQLIENNHTLLARNNFIEAIINASIDLVAVIDKSFNILEANKAIIAAFSNTGIKNFVGTNMTELYHDFPHSSIKKEIENCFTGNPIHIPEFKSFLDNQIWDLNIIPLKENDVVHSVIIIAYDITNQILVRNSLLDLNDELTYQNEIYLHAEKMMQFGTYRSDFKTRKLQYSDNLYRILGCEPGEFPPSRSEFLKYVHPDDHEYLQEISTQAYLDESIKHWEYRIIKKDGVIINVRTTGRIFTDSKGEKWLTGTIQDITDEKVQYQSLLNINEQLKQSEQRYQLMIGEVEEYAILSLDLDGYIQNWNKGVKRIHGYEEKDIVGKNFSVFYIKNDLEKKVPQSLLDEAAKFGKSKHEGWRLRNNGTVFWGYVVLTALHNENGKLIGFSKVVRDLTERKIADENIRKQTQLLEQKNRDLESMNKELQAFAYISSHDLQEPLRKIQTFSERILKSEFESMSDIAKDYFKRMQAAAFRMQRLIEDLLEYAQTSTSETNFESVSLPQLVNDVKIEMKESIENGEVNIEVTSNCYIEVIEFQFHQLFQNLFSNAIKFAKKEVPCHIVVHCNKLNGKNLLPGMDSETTYNHITVQDNGIGFEPEYNHKIFDLFKRLHGRQEYKGTGIGLAICKKIIENHKGIITAEGLPGVGATIHIYIPETQSLQ